jgi:uroporphyrinogen decarboxylase
MSLPDPEGEPFWQGARLLMEQAESEGVATCLCTRVGFSPVYLAMGTEKFAVALYENRALVEGLLERYTDWAAKVIRHGTKLGFDYLMTADDLAFKSGPLISPAMFREIFIPRMRKVADEVRLPWIFHSDGDVSPLVKDLVDLGVTALNPIEPEAMDIVMVKKEWGSHLCLVGNVSVHLLSVGKPEQIEYEVRRLLRVVAPGGGYVLGSGNSLASYCRPENVRAMIDTLRCYGSYPIATHV